MSIIYEHHQRCIASRYLLVLHGTYAVETFIQRYIFPIQFLFGLVGNGINLGVLLGAGMRNKANDLLAAMAFADSLFLIALLPHSLASFSFFAQNYHFRRVYLTYKHHFTAIANWFSAAAIWFVLAVCLERLLVIRSPLHSRFYWQRKRMTLLVTGVFTIAFIVTFHHHLAYHCAFHHFCNGTQFIAVCSPVIAHSWQLNMTNNYSSVLKSYIRTGTIVNSLFVVLLPIVAVVAINFALIYQLQMRIAEWQIGDTYRRSAAPTGTSTNERKVTITVCAIVTCFTLTQGPSLITFIWELFDTPQHHNDHFLTAVSITNNLVIVGKVLNFVLFCSSSAHFRRRVVTMLHNCCQSHSNRRAYNAQLRPPHGTLSCTVSTAITDFRHRDRGASM